MNKHDREVAASAVEHAATGWFPHPKLGLARITDDARDLLLAHAAQIREGKADA